jgi:uncharacterized protein YggE
MPTIQVRGHGTGRSEPDEAVMWITLTATADAPGEALSEVAARSNSLATVLDELQIDKADRTTSGMTVFEEFDHTQEGRKSLGHRAAIEVTLRLTDAELIGQLVSRVAAELDARIQGPRWRIAPDNPVRLEAAREAARDAERKARAYAEGVGAQLGRPLRMTEPEHGHVGWVAPARASRDHVQVDAGEHEVSASIEVTFALEFAGAP